MDRLRWDPYFPGDVYQVKVRPGDEMGMPVMDYPGEAWTLWDADREKVVMCCGVTPTLPGIGTIWAFISDDVRGHGLGVVRFVRALIDNRIASGEYRRLQCIVRADKPEYRRFIELLGFELEGLMRQAAITGEDVLLYSRVSPGRLTEH